MGHINIYSAEQMFISALLSCCEDMIKACMRGMLKLKTTEEEQRDLINISMYDPNANVLFDFHHLTLYPLSCTVPFQHTVLML